MKIIDKNAIDEARKRPVCEWCSKRFGPGDIRDVHHVQKRSLGRLDIACNLMTVHRTCHAELDTAEGYRKCLEIVGNRERCLLSEVEAVILFFSRLPKGTTRDAMVHINWTECGLDPYSPRQHELATRVWEAMPDQTPVQKPLRKKTKRKSALKERAKAARKERYQSAKAWKAKVKA